MHHSTAYIPLQYGFAAACRGAPDLLRCCQRRKDLQCSAEAGQVDGQEVSAVWFGGCEGAGGGGGGDVIWRSMQIAKTGSGQGWTDLLGVMHAVKQVYRQHH